MDAKVTSDCILKALERIVAHHPMLRCRFSHNQDAEVRATANQRIMPLQYQKEDQNNWSFRVHHNIASDDDLWNIVSTSQTSLDIVEGPVFSADVIINPQYETPLFLVAHHLVIDLVSWRVLWKTSKLSLKMRLASCLKAFHFHFGFKANLNFWKMENLKPKVKDMLRIQHTLDVEQTAQIMGQECNVPFSTMPVILTLAAVALSFQRVFPDRGPPALYNESHGRDTDTANEFMGTSRTIG
ncbi:Nonribosomal peptide synthetase [Fusarium austroafricanum]|uniref:Nonribosomal peptide synthetase n=1 Tax=Fusarium austroafricanum TaxID=2364996 RepID=A0A8H4PEA8_9HYPO|nr:Nonribosomal peptide synthetase [Fusarium austroafricanum]